MWSVYILLCKDGSLYTGITNNLEKRVLEHKSGKGGRYTRSHKVIRLVYEENLPTYSSALKRELHIKSWTRKAKIEKLKLGL